MKPVFFQDLDALLDFIRHLPEPEGQTKLGDAAELKERSLRLAPKMFELREVLVKSPKGVGNYKSLYRFSDAVADRLCAETGETLKKNIETIDAEVQELLDLQANDDMVDTLRTARTKAARFRALADSMNGFQAKQKELLGRIEADVARLLANLEDNLASMRRLLGADAETIRNDYSLKLTKVQGLAAVLDEYHDVQIAYNGLFFA